MKVIHDASKSEKVIPAEFPKFPKNEKQMSFARKHDKEMKKEIDEGHQVYVVSPLTLMMNSFSISS